MRAALRRVRVCARRGVRRVHTGVPALHRDRPHHHVEYPLEAALGGGLPPDARVAGYSLRELQTAYAREELTPEQVTRIMLDRINALNPALKFMACRNPHALDAAVLKYDAPRRAQAPRNPQLNNAQLYGVPFTCHDARLRWPEFDPALLGVGAHDVTAARRLQQIGRDGVFLGYNALPPFGYNADAQGYSGVSVSPYDPTRTATGSCGGSAVAVATHCAYFALGLDAFGSLRYSAAANSVYCVVPATTAAAVASPGCESSTPSLVRPGVVARSVEDVAAVLGPDYVASLETNATQPLKVGVFGGDADVTVPAVRDYFDSAVNFFAEDKHVVCERVQRLVHFDLTRALTHFARRRAHDALRTIPPSAVSQDPTADAFLRAPVPSAEEYRAAAAQLTGDAVRDVSALLSRYDALIQPTFFCEPWTTDADAARAHPKEPSQFSHTALYNFTGHAAASVPIGLSREGMPIGLHVAVKADPNDVDARNSTRLLLHVLQRFRKAVRFDVQFGHPFMPALQFRGVLTGDNFAQVLPYVQKPAGVKCCPEST